MDTNKGLAGLLSNISANFDVGGNVNVGIENSTYLKLGLTIAALILLFFIVKKYI
jgi:hypothetical protein